MPTWLTTIILLCISNIFMTFAWYYHLREKTWPLMVAIFASWGIALAEYMLMVPANRIGHVSTGGPFTGPQLKIMQEVITLTVFGIFSWAVLKEKLYWTDYVAFALILLGAMVGLFGKDIFGK